MSKAAADRAVAAARALLRGPPMHDDRTKPALKLPKKLAFTAMRIAIAGTVACSGETQQGPTDAASDVTVVDAAPDAPGDVAVVDSAPDVLADVAADAAPDDAPADAPKEACAFAEYYCGSSGGPDAASCPGPICNMTDCPPGCVLEPIA